jgi:UDP-N-acetylmuramate dehydrogenase
MQIQKALESAFGAERVRSAVPMAPMTTFKVGGIADWLIETRGAGEVERALAVAREAGVPVTMLGGGSNVLVSDRGVRGLVIRPRGGSIQAGEHGRVRADAAVTINGLVRWTISNGYAGLAAWAGTPGTVGGALVGNAHYGGRLISEVVLEARVVTPEGSVVDVEAAEMAFAYDESRLQHSCEVLLSAVFGLSPGADPGVLRAVARRSLDYRKRTQPLNAASAGCIFRNPGAGEPLPADVPASAGALIDLAGLKGFRIGGARVSLLHANFIVNEGSATACDIWSLVSLCRNAVYEKFGVRLRTEIAVLGEFEP